MIRQELSIVSIGHIWALMIAKNDEAHMALAQVKDKKSLRKYRVSFIKNLPNDRGVIEAPIGRSEKDRKKQAVTAKGKSAVTRFQVVERFATILQSCNWKQDELIKSACTWLISRPSCGWG